LARALGLSPADESERHMPTNIPNEIVVAKLSIEAACTALESLFERMKVMPRAEKVIVSETVREACARLQAAKELLAQLETVQLAGDRA
jgi:hypothetical protein